MRVTLRKSGTGNALSRQSALIAVAGTLPFGLARSDTAEVSGPTNLITRLPAVVVEGRADSLLGIADSAGQGTTGAAQLAERPILRSGEVLETVPGVMITQHAGGGKANQYFLRGFNLDHGTDFAVLLDDMPLNLPSHAHGQGYADMNIVIPELIQRVDYAKGPYFANLGDFSSAGAARLEFYRVLPHNFVTLEGGMFNYERGVFGVSKPLVGGNLLIGGEAYHDDGPWDRPDDYRKFNGQITYSQGTEALGWSATVRGYHGKWNSSDQIPASFGAMDYFGTLDNSTGGNSQRYSAQVEWHRTSETSATKVMAYGFYYDLDLFSNFTYFLVDTDRGDQFEQADRRLAAGLDARHTLFNRWFDRDVENTFGIQARNDWIRNGLYQTQRRLRVDKTAAESGDTLPATTRADHLSETGAGVYFENKIQWAEKFRSVAGLRADFDYFDVNSNDPRNSGNNSSFLPSPKLSLIFGPWAKTECYALGGFGFHSNDGRGTTTTENPDGTLGTKIDGLIETRGAEIGVRTLALPRLQSTLSLWYLHSDSELQQEGDTGGTVASKSPSSRYGIEWANYYELTKHVALDLDCADSWARFTEVDGDDAAPGSGGGDRVPEAVGLVVSAGVTLHDFHGFFGSVRLRYFGPRDLTSDGIYQSNETLLLNAEIGYQIDKTWRISAEILNVLDRRDHDIDYAYESRTSPSGPPAFQNVFHPVEPVQVRVGLTARF